MGSGEVAGAKMAASAARSALGSSSEEEQKLADIAEDTPEMKLAAQKYAHRLAIKQGLLLKLYQPLAKWAGASREYFEEDFAADMAGRIAEIPEEDLTAPPPSVAVPAMQGLGYSLGEPALKEMYLSLLATASDARKGESAHPSFADIIRQLSPREAGLLPSFLTGNVEPIVRLSKKVPPDVGKGHALVANHVVQLRDQETGGFIDEPLLPVWIENWIRLGLIEVDYSRHLTADGAYAWAEDHPHSVRIAEADDRGSAAVRIDKGLLRATDFGRTFAGAATPTDEVMPEP